MTASCSCKVKKKTRFCRLKSVWSQLAMSIINAPFKFAVNVVDFHGVMLHFLATNVHASVRLLPAIDPRIPLLLAGGGAVLEMMRSLELPFDVLQFLLHKNMKDSKKLSWNQFESWNLIKKTIFTLILKKKILKKISNFFFQYFLKFKKNLIFFVLENDFEDWIWKKC